MNIRSYMRTMPASININALLVVAKTKNVVVCEDFQGRTFQFPNLDDSAKIGSHIVFQIEELHEEQDEEEEPIILSVDMWKRMSNLKMKDGGKVGVKSMVNESVVYDVKMSNDGHLSCTCPAYTYCKQEIKTCKHCKAVFGAI